MALTGLPAPKGLIAKIIGTVGDAFRTPAIDIEVTAVDITVSNNLRGLPSVKVKSFSGISPMDSSWQATSSVPFGDPNWWRSVTGQEIPYEPRECANCKSGGKLLAGLNIDADLMTTLLGCEKCQPAK